MFAGTNNKLLDSTAFRFGVLALGFAVWAGTAIGLIAAS